MKNSEETSDKDIDVIPRIRLQKNNSSTDIIKQPSIQMPISELRRREFGMTYTSASHMSPMDIMEMVEQTPLTSGKRGSINLRAQQS